MPAKKAQSGEIAIIEVEQPDIKFFIKGKSPFICNAMSAKVKQELLMPRGRKTAADKAANMKHDCLQEYRDSIYKMREGSPTYIGVPSTMFKASMRNAAVDLPGSSKAQIGRLTYVNGSYVFLYGIPEMLMSVTRSADMNKTPDVRTRAIIPEWCCEIVVTYTAPLIREVAVARLLAAAGLINGIGDWRPERGKGDYGQFQVVSDDKDFKRIKDAGGYDAQKFAMEEPSFYDTETESLYEWWDTERRNRGFKVVA